MRRLAVLVLALVAAVPAARAAGPSPGFAMGGSGVAAGPLSYSTVAAGAGATTLLVRRGDALVRRVPLAGRWAVPLVSFGNDRGGVSPDGSTLVLAERYPLGTLRSVSRFLVQRTDRLGSGSVVRLRGDFSFDALSPNGRWLYLTQHMSREDVARYVVRAYDLRAGRLLARTIADKRQAGWVMSGFPARRVTSPGGRWAYTLYQQNANYPFVHALDTVNRTAICIGIPWPWTGDGVWNADVSLHGNRLTIEANGRRAVIDTRTLRLVRS